MLGDNEHLFHGSGYYPAEKLFSVILIIMAKDIKLKLAQRIRELRKKHNYTQQKLAELTNIDYKHIQLLESKKPCAARIDTIEKLAKAFK